MKCAYCDRPAKYLCDHRLGPDQTCDRPLCELHRVNLAQGLACTRGKAGGCRPFSFDRCPDHAPTVSTKE